MTSPRHLLKTWNLRARKRLGQNFLKNPAVAVEIVNQAQLTDQDIVMEIGAGLGAVTVIAARQAGRVIAVERDSRLIPLLRSELLVNGADQVEIIEQDILTLNLEALAKAYGGRLVVLGNLPYNISTPMLVQLIKARHVISRAVLMFQKELAERLYAPPGNKTYGRLSVLLQYYADIQRLHVIQAEQFFPRPKIDSVVLRIDFKSSIQPAVRDDVLFERVIQVAFGQRRKTLRNALSSGRLPLTSAAAAQLLTATGINPHRRAETLSVDEFVGLSNCIGQYLA